MNSRALHLKSVICFGSILYIMCFQYTRIIDNNNPSKSLVLSSWENIPGMKPNFYTIYNDPQ